MTNQYHKQLLSNRNIQRSYGTSAVLTAEGRVLLRGGVAMDLSLDRLLEGYIANRVRIPENIEDYAFSATRKEGVYYCQGREKTYLTSHKSCTCESWSEQGEMVDWLKGQGVDYKPMCKHQVMLGLHSQQHQPKRAGRMVAWKIDGGMVQLYTVKNFRQTELFKEIGLNEYLEKMVLSILHGWGWTRNNTDQLTILQRTGKR